MAGTQFDKGNSFSPLHQGPRSFIIAPTLGTPDRRGSWLAIGFAAVATSSGAAAGKARRVEARALPARRFHM